MTLYRLHSVDMKAQKIDFFVVVVCFKLVDSTNSALMKVASLGICCCHVMVIWSEEVALCLPTCRNDSSRLETFFLFL